MKRSKNSRNLAIISIGIAFLLIGYALLSNYSSSGSKINTEGDNLPKYVDIQAKVIVMHEKLGENTPYPEIYMMAETLTKINGIKADLAIDQATDRYTERKALAWYAEKSGFSVSKQEVERYIEVLISTSKKAENYDTINDAYKSAGISLEEHYRANYSFYSDDYVIGKFYDQWLADNVSSEELTEDEAKAVDEKWEIKVGNIKSEYKSSKEYKSLLPAVSESKKLYSKGTGNNLKVLKAARIFTEDK